MNFESANNAVDKTAGMPPAKLLNKVFIVVIGLLIIGIVIKDRQHAADDKMREKFCEQETARANEAQKRELECYNGRFERAESTAARLIEQRERELETK